MDISQAAMEDAELVTIRAPPVRDLWPRTVPPVPFLWHCARASACEAVERVFIRITTSAGVATRPAAPAWARRPRNASDAGHQRRCCSLNSLQKEPCTDFASLTAKPGSTWMSQESANSATPPVQAAWGTLPGTVRRACLPTSCWKAAASPSAQRGCSAMKIAAPPVTHHARRAAALLSRSA